MRAIAALSVVVGHTVAAMAPQASSEGGIVWRLLSPATQGLTLFFVLSGFLLFRPFVTSVVSGTRAPGWARFLRNRAVRILPAYVFILLVTSYVLGVARLSDQSAAVSAEGAGRLPLVDLLWSLPLVQTFNPEQMRTGIGVAWSLTVETCFYALVPLCALAAARLARPLGRWAAVLAPAAAFLAVGVAGKIWLLWETRNMSEAAKFNFEWGQTWSAVVARSILVHGDLFAYGMAAAVLYVAVEQGAIGRDRAAAMRLPLIVTAIAGAGAASVGSLLIFQDAAAAIACTAALLFLVLPTRRGAAAGSARLMEWAPSGSSGSCPMAFICGTLASSGGCSSVDGASRTRSWGFSLTSPLLLL
nr:acyltransferase family protein [Nocardioides houyundeii]